MCVSQYFPGALLFFTATLSRITNTERASGFETLLDSQQPSQASLIKRQRGMANRPRVRLTTGRVPSQSLHLFKTCCTNFLQDFHSKPIFHRAERKEVEGCFLRPLCDMFWHRLHGNPDLVIFLIETSIKWRAKGNFYGSILLRYFY